MLEERWKKGGNKFGASYVSNSETLPLYHVLTKRQNDLGPQIVCFISHKYSRYIFIIIHFLALVQIHPAASVLPPGSVVINIEKGGIVMTVEDPAVGKDIGVTNAVAVEKDLII